MYRHRFTVELEIDLSHPPDGWHAVVADQPSVQIYGSSKSEALAKAKALALRLLADRVEHDSGEQPHDSDEQPHDSDDRYR
jgi:hypothetical protein